MRLQLLRYDCDTGRTCPQVHSTDHSTYVFQGYVTDFAAAATVGLDVPAGSIVVELPASLLSELSKPWPAMRRTDRDTILVCGPPLTDPEALAELAVPAGEAAIELPRSAVPALWLDEAQLGAFIDANFTSQLFRLETLPHYDVASDGDDLAAYLAGKPGPDMARKGPWLDVIRGEVARGLHTYRVHVVRGPLTPYLCYEFEWGYVHNQAAGEQIRILDITEQDAPDGLIDEDFWLITGDDGAPDQVARMIYDGRGRFLHAQVVSEADVDRYLRARAAAWETAVPFDFYWRSHPQYWRARRPAA